MGTLRGVGGLNAQNKEPIRTLLQIAMRGPGFDFSYHDKERERVPLRDV